MLFNILQCIQQSPATKNCPTQNFNSNEVGKPWYKERSSATNQLLMALKTRRQAAQDILQLSPCHCRTNEGWSGSGSCQMRETNPLQPRLGQGEAWTLPAEVGSWKGLTVSTADFTCLCSCARDTGIPFPPTSLHPPFPHPSLPFLDYFFPYSLFFQRLSSR